MEVNENGTPKVTKRKSKTPAFSSVTCRRVLNVMVFIGFMINYMLRVNLTLAIVDMVKKPNSTTVTITPDLFVSNRTVRSIPDFINMDALRADKDNYDDSLDGEEPVISFLTNTESYSIVNENLTNQINILEKSFNINGDNSHIANKTASSKYVKRFNWSEADQNLLLGSFFWGYVCTELPGGRLSELIGTRKVFGLATLGASVITLITPLAAKIHLYLALAARLLLGFCMGPTWPSILPLAAKWIPSDERGKFLSNMIASSLGAGITLPICGLIIDKLSWEFVFYVTGFIAFLYSVLWFLLIYDSPSVHPRISSEERWYIESKLGLISAKNSSTTINGEEKQAIRNLIGNNGRVKEDSGVSDSDNSQIDIRVHDEDNRNYSTFIQNGSGHSISRVVSTELQVVQKQPITSGSDSDVPIKLKRTYSNSGLSPNTIESHHLTKEYYLLFIPSMNRTVMRTFRGYISSHLCQYGRLLPLMSVAFLAFIPSPNGALSSLPYFGKYITALVGGSVADILLTSSILTRNTVRKLFTLLGVMIPGFLMIVFIFLGNDKIWAIVLFTVTLTANGLISAGYLGNSLELASNYSGTIFGMANMLSGLSGALSAILVGYLTDHNQVYGQWQKVYAVVAICYIIGGLTFVIFGSTETQYWNTPTGIKNKQGKIGSV